MVIDGGERRCGGIVADQDMGDETVRERERGGRFSIGVAVCRDLTPRLCVADLPGKERMRRTPYRAHEGCEIRFHNGPSEEGDPDPHYRTMLLIQRQDLNALGSKRCAAPHIHRRGGHSRAKHIQRPIAVALIR